MHPIGRFRGCGNNPGHGPQSFKKVRTGNKWVEYFNLTKALGEVAKIRRAITKPSLYYKASHSGRKCWIANRYP